MTRPDTRVLSLKLFAATLILALLLASCSPGLFSTAPTPPPQVSPAVETTGPLNPQQTLVRFRLQTPPDSPPGDLAITLLDEVTGLALNTTSYPLTPEESTGFASIELPLPVGSVIKYRYNRLNGIPAEEHLADGRQVRYRLFHVTGPAAVEDVVTRWSDTAFSGATGRIQGRATDLDTGQPLPGILIASGGAQTMTASDGTFLIEGLPAGVHHLVAYSLDGAYAPFQQGARVAVGASTPADVAMARAALVNVTFKVDVPEGTPPGVPLRLAGNLFQMGNTFGTLAGGMSNSSTRLPLLALQEDGSYALTLALPVGADVRYKYTLGDGFWNAERQASGQFRLRQLIVPPQDLVVNDLITTWSDDDGKYIAFDVTAPANTPPGEAVSLQLNAFGWTQPIPMWPVGGERWIYLLYSPVKSLSQLSYRYCRNEQCNAADALETVGAESPGLPVDLANFAAKPAETISGWRWLDAAPPLVPAPTGQYTPRPDSYLSGIEFQPAYLPSWPPRLDYALADIAALQARWVVFTPTWSYSQVNPPVLEQLNGQDAMWLDMLGGITQARQAGFQAAIYPHLNFQMPVNDWWARSARDFSWWVQWFERYRVFLLNHADMASRSGAQALILGGSWLTPALPGGLLPDGSPSGVPQDAEIRWRNLIAEVRARYDGALLWAMPSPGSLAAPAFLTDVDMIYLLWSARLSEADNAPVDVLWTEAARLLDEQVAPLAAASGKPVVLAVSYPSANGAATGCVPVAEGVCVDLNQLAAPNPDIDSIPLDLEEQALAYNALLQAANSRDWITGVVSQGYYPPAVLQDKSASIHGKPAAEIIKYIFTAWRTPQ